MSIYTEVLRKCESHLTTHEIEHLIGELEDIVEAREDAELAEEDDRDDRQMSIEEAEKRQQADNDMFDLEEGNGLDDLDNITQ